MTYMEYLNEVLPQSSKKFLNTVFWCDLFNDGICKRPFTAEDKVVPCPKCMEEEMLEQGD